MCLHLILFLTVFLCDFSVRWCPGPLHQEEPERWQPQDLPWLLPCAWGQRVRQQDYSNLPLLAERCSHVPKTTLERSKQSELLCFCTPAPREHVSVLMLRGDLAWGDGSGSGLYTNAKLQVKHLFFFLPISTAQADDNHRRQSSTCLYFVIVKCWWFYFLTTIKLLK